MSRQSRQQYVRQVEMALYVGVVALHEKRRSPQRAATFRSVHTATPASWFQRHNIVVVETMCRRSSRRIRQRRRQATVIRANQRVRKPRRHERQVCRSNTVNARLANGQQERSIGIAGSRHMAERTVMARVGGAAGRRRSTNVRQRGNVMRKRGGSEAVNYYIGG